MAKSERHTRVLQLLEDEIIGCMLYSPEGCKGMHDTTFMKYGFLRSDFSEKNQVVLTAIAQLLDNEQEVTSQSVLDWILDHRDHPSIRNVSQKEISSHVEHVGKMFSALVRRRLGELH